MNFYDHPQTLLEDRISDWRRGRPFIRKYLVVALTVVLLGCSAQAFSQPIKLGYAALSAGHVEVQQTCITVTSKYLREHRPVVKSFVQAYGEGLHRFFTDRDFSIQVMKKYLRVNEKELLEDAYDFYVPRLQKIPYPTFKGIQFILDEIAERQPQARKATPESFVDLSLLQEIDQNGFFKQLWKN